jgi:2-keto-3-deoxy-L-rhamnonate aldolase
MSLPDRSNGINTSRGAQASPPPQGIYVPVPTFFAKEGTAEYDAVTPPLDLDAQTEHSLFLVKGGIKGLVILGSTGEAIFLRAEERSKLIASQRKALNDAGYKDRPIIAGTATQQIDDTLDLIKSSKEAGAEYAMVLGPGYFAPATSQEGIQKWFEAVADRSVLPVMM